MTKLMVPVNEKNKDFILYNHLFSKTDEFTLEELQAELKDMYGLEMDMSDLRYKIREYLDSGLVVHSFNKYVSYMRNS